VDVGGRCVDAGIANRRPLGQRKDQRSRRKSETLWRTRTVDPLLTIEEVLGDEPDWAGLLFVAPIELDERDVSAN
jgi:hypothetical protein